MQIALSKLGYFILPTSAMRVCRKQGCYSAHKNKNGYCEKHQSSAIGWYERKSNWDGKGSTRRWRTKLRPAVLRRDEGLCQPCLRAGRYTPGTEVDHIISKANGGTDDLDNLELICTECHKAKTSQERGGASKV